MTVWANGSTVMPPISSPYGYSDGYDGFHGGTDFYGFDYNCAHEDGTVIFAGWTDFGDLGAGIEIAIQHDGWVSRLLHNASVYSGIGVGSQVKAGQPVGVQGGSGYEQLWHFKKHCHDEVRLGGRNGLVTDPVPFLRARVGATPADSGSRPFPTKPKGNNDMPILFHKESTATRGPILYALAGSSPGTPANWKETTAQKFANQLSDQVGGPSAGVSDEYWEELKADYLAPLNVRMS